MNSYFHLAPILLAPGSMIEPGNFGRLIAAHGASHPLHRREMAYELVRRSAFNTRPSRLNCVFCYPTEAEANLCHAHHQGFANSVLYEVECSDPDPLITDANSHLQNAALPSFDPKIIALYWQGCQAPFVAGTGILRELLSRTPMRIVRRI